MRQTLFRLALTVAAALGSGVAVAQTLTIDGTFSTSFVPVSGQSSLTINPADGAVVLTSGRNLQCTIPSGGTPSVTVSAPNSALVNTSVSVSWSSVLTTGTNPCSPSGGTGTNWANQGPAAASGTRNVTLPGTAGAVTFTMTCTTATGTVTNSATVTVSPESVVGCEGTPSNGLTPQGFPSTWSDVFGGGAFWPNPNGNFLPVSMNRNQFAAIAFTSGSGGQQPNGRLETSEAPSANGGPVLISLSRCAGDFRPSLRVGQTCMSDPNTNSIQQNVLWGTGTETGASFCTLTPNTNYYVNTTNRTNSSDCQESSCSILLGNRVFARAAESEAAGVPWPAGAREGTGNDAAGGN